jgi:PAS domain S-box-containing protein
MVDGGPPSSDDVLAAMLSTTAVGIAVIGADGRVARSNRLFARITGQRPGQRFAELTHPDDVAAGEALLGQLASNRRDGYRVERSYVGTDSITRWVTITMSSASAALVVAVAEDVTDSKELGHELAERVKELTALHAAGRLMLDSTRPRALRLAEVTALLPAAMQYPDITTGCVRVGAERHATPGHAPGPWVLAAAFRTAAGEDCAVEVAYREERPAEAIGPFLVEEQTLLDSLADVIRSALDRDAADLEMLLARNRLSFALEAAGMAVWEWDVDNDRVYFSDHLAAMVGITALVGGRLGEHADLLHEADRARVLQAARLVADGGSPVEAMDARLRRPDGTWRPVQVYAHRTGDRRVLAVFVDVTVRQTLEAALRSAQKLEALGQVAGGVAHDFNNLLQVIITGADGLRRELPRGEMFDIANDVYTAGTRGAELTGQLLTFTRSASFRPAAVDVNAAIRGLEPILARLVKHHATLTLELDAAAGRIWADPTQVEQVVMNLVVNARDAIETAGGIVVSTSCAVEDGNAYTVIGVRDNGPGISPELRGQIFEPFFTTKPAGKGTGLGLAVVQNVARQWRGRVTVDSEPGQGATFRVLLPQYVG